MHCHRNFVICHCNSVTVIRNSVILDASVAMTPTMRRISACWIKIEELHNAWILSLPNLVFA